MVERKEIPPETLVWHEKMEHWEPISKVGDFKKKDSLPSAPRESVDSQRLHVRPWPRFFARVLDYSFFSVLVTILLEIFGVKKLPVTDALFGLFLLFIWVFIEAFCLAKWGHTPGKWLFKIEVRKKDGSKPTYGEALTRSFTVWLVGMGVGFPIISIITMIAGALTLKKKGITSWDRSGSFTITHHKLGFWRVFIATVLLFFIGLTLLASLKILFGIV